MERETFNNHNVYSLSEVAMSVHRVIERTYTRPYYIKAEIYYIDVFTRDEEIMCCDSFKECEQKLVDSAFVRIHRS